MTVAIVDDDKKMRDLLTNYLHRMEKEFDLSFSITAFESGMTFLKEYTNTDIVLLDIDMPVINGMETAKELRKLDTQVVIVFITNLAQYAINGYEVNAVSYILKPVHYFDLAFKLRRAAEIAERNKRADIVISAGTVIKRVDISDVAYVEAVKHKVIYHLRNGTYETWDTLGNAEKKLDYPCFIRTNRCYIVNMNYITEINDIYITVNGDRLLVSRSRKKELVEKFTQWGCSR